MIKMADRERDQSTQGNDLQHLVRTIVTDLMSHGQEHLSEERASVNKEVNTVFRIPRGNTNQSAENVPSTSSNVSVRSSIRGNISSYFNPSQNYGQHQPQRRRQAVRQNPIQAAKHSRMQSSKTNIKYIKDVFLLPSPLWITIPRRDKKAFLQTNNFVVIAFIIDKRWNLSELKSQFCQLFVSNEMNTLEDIGFV